MHGSSLLSAKASSGSRYTASVLLLLLFSLSSFLYGQQRHTSPSPNFKNEVRVLVEKFRIEHRVPGVTLAVALHDSLVWEAAFGLADVENDVALSPQSVFRIASISKPIAAIAVMQLVEQGKVSLDDDIRTYVPAFPKKRWPVTLRHILTHTSGIRHYRPGEFLIKDHFDTLEQAIAIFREDSLKFQPGTQFSYSSYAFNLLAGVVEKAAGMSFEQYLQKFVWEPAHMRRTFFEHQLVIVPLRSRHYIVREGELFNAPFVDLSIKWAGGGMISSAGDLIRLHIALDKGLLLSAETRRLMQTPYKLSNGETISKGLAWSISRDSDGHTIVSHSGGATGGTTFLGRIPETGFALAILTNLQGVGKPLRELFQAISHSAGY